MRLATVDLATALEQWAAETLGINTVEHAPTSLQEVLPLVICEVLADARADTNPSHPGLGAYQQTYVRDRGARLLLMVHSEPSWDATKLLYGYVDTLAQSILNDPSLGGQVHHTSPFYTASYDPPEVQYEDGTVARAASFTMSIAETTEV